MANKKPAATVTKLEFFTKKQIAKIDAAREAARQALQTFVSESLDCEAVGEESLRIDWLSNAMDKESNADAPTKADQKRALSGLAKAQKQFKKVEKAAAAVKKTFKNLRSSMEKKIAKAEKRAAKAEKKGEEKAV